MKPVPVVTMEEVIAQLSERGLLEWNMATTKAQLAKALADDEPVAESGHFPEPSAVPPPEHSGEITLDNGGATPV